MNPFRSVKALPSVFCVGGVQLTVALPVDVATTVIVNPASDAVEYPSETEIAIPAYVPMSAAAGVPKRRPLVELKDAHDGLLTIAKLSAGPSGSDTFGVKSYG